jgi:hypothetical protein
MIWYLFITTTCQSDYPIPSSFPTLTFSTIQIKISIPWQVTLYIQTKNSRNSMLSKSRHSSYPTHNHHTALHQDCRTQAWPASHPIASSCSGSSGGIGAISSHPLAFGSEIEGVDQRTSRILARSSPFSRSVDPGSMGGSE